MQKFNLSACLLSFYLTACAQTKNYKGIYIENSSWEDVSLISDFKFLLSSNNSHYFVNQLKEEGNDLSHVETHSNLFNAPLKMYSNREIDVFFNRRYPFESFIARFNNKSVIECIVAKESFEDRFERDFLRKLEKTQGKVYSKKLRKIDPNLKRTLNLSEVLHINLDHRNYHVNQIRTVNGRISSKSGEDYHLTCARHGIGLTKTLEFVYSNLAGQIELF